MQPSCEGYARVPFPRVDRGHTAESMQLLSKRWQAYLRGIQNSFLELAEVVWSMQLHFQKLAEYCVESAAHCKIWQNILWSMQLLFEELAEYCSQLCSYISKIWQNAV